MKKLKALNSPNQACLICPPKPVVLPMRYRVAVGFGDAHVEVDGEIVWREAPGMEYEDTSKRIWGLRDPHPRGDMNGAE